jgi:transcriptional regulator with XRE-family HTH domain
MRNHACMPTAIVDPEKVAARVRWLRAEHGWTQAELAEKSGLKPRTVQKIEAGGNGRERTYVLLARALDVPLAQLLNGKEE